MKRCLSFVERLRHDIATHFEKKEILPSKDIGFEILFCLLSVGFSMTFPQIFPPYKKFWKSMWKSGFVFHKEIYEPEISFDSSVISIKKAASLIVLSSTFL